MHACTAMHDRNTCKDPMTASFPSLSPGKLGLVDHDVVEVSNLHRQIIHTEGRVGVHKAISASTSCLALNPTTDVRLHLDGLKVSSISSSDPPLPLPRTHWLPLSERASPLTFLSLSLLPLPSSSGLKASHAPCR